MILVDFSAIMFQNIFGASKSSENTDDLVKNTIGSIFYTLTYYQKMFKKYGNLVICLDSHTKNWRKDVLKSYKSQRKENRDHSVIPFDVIFKAINVSQSGLEAERAPTKGRKRRHGCRRQRPEPACREATGGCRPKGESD